LPDATGPSAGKILDTAADDPRQVCLLQPIRIDQHEFPDADAGQLLRGHRAHSAKADHADAHLSKTSLAHRTEELCLSLMEVRALTRRADGFWSKDL
jgi:hypothetical protein